MNTSISLTPIIQELVPYLVTIVSAVLMVILRKAGQSFTAWTGIEMEARHRETLHSAAMTGIQSALARASKQLGDINLETRSFVVAAAANWVITNGASQAVAHFGLTPEGVSQVVDAKLSKLLLDAKVLQPTALPVS